MTIFRETTYRQILENKIQENATTRGYNKLLARAAACHTSLISQVRHSHVHLTVDQGAGLCQFWGFTDLETEYFLSLLMLERSNGRAFQHFLKKKLSTLRSQHRQISHRTNKAEILGVEQQCKYYSQWYYGAIHVLCGLKGFRDPNALADHLGIPVGLVGKVIDDLVEMGLVKRGRTGLQYTSRSIHVGPDSPLNAVNHRNWRQHSLSKLSVGSSTESVNYTAAYTLSLQDFEKIRDMVMRMIEDSRHVVGASKDEMGCCMILDFFPL